MLGQFIGAFPVQVDMIFRRPAVPKHEHLNAAPAVKADRFKARRFFVNYSRATDRVLHYKITLGAACEFIPNPRHVPANSCESVRNPCTLLVKIARAGVSFIPARASSSTEKC